MLLSVSFSARWDGFNQSRHDFSIKHKKANKFIYQYEMEMDLPTMKQKIILLAWDAVPVKYKSVHF